MSKKKQSAVNRVVMGLTQRNTVLRALLSRRNAGGGKHQRSNTALRQQQRLQLRRVAFGADT